MTGPWCEVCGERIDDIKRVSEIRGERCPKCGLVKLKKKVENPMSYSEKIKVIFESSDAKDVAIMEFMEFMGHYFPPKENNCFKPFFMRLYDAVKSADVKK